MSTIYFVDSMLDTAEEVWRRTYSLS